MEVVDEIKAKLGIYEVASQYMQLKKAGVNYKGLCPFHGEKTASFVVSPGKQIFHCFGCSKGGDIFTFVQEIEGVEFPDALKLLADKAGVKLPEKTLNFGPSKSEKQQLYDAQELAANFFVKQLWDTEDGQKVLKYLYSRGLKDQTIKDFKLGFAPDKKDILYRHLLNKGVSKKIMISTGLISSKNISSQEAYDKFRKRLIFPIFDYLGKIAGFGGRALSKDQMPKYLNSPESPIYNKSNILYGLYQAKQDIKVLDEAILVEGYFDMILPFQEGVKNIVATCGTALTDKHAKLLGRLTKKVLTLFDNDKAGFQATRRAYDVLFNEDFLVKTVVGLGEKDAADIVKNHPGTLEELLKNSKEFVIVLLEKLLKENDLNSLEGVRNITGEILPLIARMNSMEKDFFLQKISLQLGVNKAILYDQLNSLKSDKVAKTINSTKEIKNEKFDTLDILFALIFEYPVIFDYEVLRAFNFGEDNSYIEVYNALLDQYNLACGNLKSWNFSALEEFLKPEKINKMRIFAEEKYQNFSLQALKEELRKLKFSYEQNRQNNELKDIEIKIRQAEKEKDFEKLKALLEKQQNLLS